MTPRVSVVVPTRDRLELLRRALASIEAQGYRDFEIVVVDDGSTDGTSAWLSSGGFGGNLISMPVSGGSAAARNRGIATASGELLAFLDDDDVWQPDYLEAQVGNLDRHPEAALSYTDHVEIDPKGRALNPDTRALLSYQDPLVRLLAEGFIHTMSVVMIRRDLIDRVGLLDERLTIVHDLDWYGRMLGLELSFSRVGRPLVGRSLPGGLIGHYRRWFAEEQDVLRRAIDRSPGLQRQRTMIRTQRSLFFAKVALGRGDLTFAFRCLLDAVVASPSWTVRVVLLRLVRWIGFQRGSGSWDAAGVNAL